MLRTFLAYTNLGMAYINQKKVSEAKENYLKALNIDPEIAFAWNNLGNEGGTGVEEKIDG